MKRIFIAVKIEPEKELSEMFSSFRLALKDESIKWTEVSNLHLTLIFLGDTDENRIKEIDILLGKICSGFRSFSFKISGAGVFKNLRDPRIIWAGISGNEKLNELHSLISSALQETGTGTEEKNYRPHLTLGRIRRIQKTKDLSDLLETNSNKTLQLVKCKEVILYESILKPGGAQYRPLGRYSFPAEENLPG